jgi:hypothetical protein
MGCMRRRIVVAAAAAAPPPPQQLQLQFHLVHGLTAVLLGMQGILMMSIVTWLDTEAGVSTGRFRVVRATPVWREGTDTTAAEEALLQWSMGVDTRFIIIACLGLGAVRQGLGLVVHQGRSAHALRWLEYSGTVPALTMAVALEAGVRDVYALEAIFGLMWTAQVLGLCADLMMRCAESMALARAESESRRRRLTASAEEVEEEAAADNHTTTHHNNDDPFLWWLGTRACMVPLCAAATAFLMAFGPILDALLQSHRRVPVPLATRILVLGEVVLLGGTGLVQARGLCAITAILSSEKEMEKDPLLLLHHSSTYYYYYYYYEAEEEEEEAVQAPLLLLHLSQADRIETIGARCERAHALLSFASKTLLCWTVLGPVIAKWA